MRNVVWEHIENGTRFRTVYNKDETYKDSEHHKLIGTDLSDEDSLVLVKQTEDKNISSYLSSLPNELRNPSMDAMIEGMIRNG